MPVEFPQQLQLLIESSPPIEAAPQFYSPLYETRLFHDNYDRINLFICRLEAEVRAGIRDDAELAEQVRQQSESLDATKKVMSVNVKVSLFCILLSFIRFLVNSGIVEVQASGS